MSEIREIIGRLVRLQALDAQLRKMHAVLEELPSLLSGERADLERVRARLQAAEKKAQDAHRAADRKELDVRTREAEVLKLEGQLNNATSNKVYSDLLLAVKGHQADISRLEEVILGLMDDAEALEGEVEVVRVELRKAEESFRETEKEVSGKIAEVRVKADEKQKIRDLLASEIDPESLNIYDRVREIRNGVGIAGVEADAEGSHFCNACQMTITLQDVSVALTGGRIVQCRSCNRILVTSSLAEA